MSIYQVFHGHTGSVTCLLYPHDENPRYDEIYLISGGSDFTVRAWDLASGTLLHTFHCHGGEVLRLMVTPPECNVRLVPNCLLPKRTKFLLELCFSGNALINIEKFNVPKPCF